LAVNPTTPGTLYAGINGGEVFKSTNRGSGGFVATFGSDTWTVFLPVILKN
jgi:hypothetical protein